MKVTAIDHIGIAVENMDEALRFYCDRLGMRADPIEDIPAYDIRLCKVHAGPIYLELIEAKDWNTTMMRALPTQGPGVYHVGLRVDDVDASIAELAREGVGLLDPVPREGEDMRISYLSPKSAAGALVELVQRTPHRSTTEVRGGGKRGHRGKTE